MYRQLHYLFFSGSWVFYEYGKPLCKAHYATSKLQLIMQDLNSSSLYILFKGRENVERAAVILPL